MKKFVVFAFVFAFSTAALALTKPNHPCQKEIYNSASAVFAETYKQDANDRVRVSDLTSVDKKTFLINYELTRQDGSVEDHSYRVNVANKCVVTDVTEQ